MSYLQSQNFGEKLKQRKHILFGNELNNFGNLKNKTKPEN